MRIPVLGALTSRRPSDTEIGAGTAIPIPALPAITLRANGRGKVSVEGPVQRERSGELEPYDTFRCGAYCFQFVPPTPDGLGIPVDYEARTVAYKTPLDVPSLLVRSGAVEALMRKFPLRGKTAFVGGAPDLEVPLFRCELRVAARLTMLGEAERFGARVKVARADGAKVRVDGAFGAEGVLMQLDTVEIEGWEFVLLPASAGR